MSATRRDTVRWTPASTNKEQVGAMLEAVIFDNDGLLVDSEPVWDAARAAMAKENGQSWDENDHKAVMGVSTQEWADYMIQRLQLDMPVNAVVQHIIDRMSAMYRERIPFLPGATAAVERSAAHLPTAIASGSHPALLEIVTGDKALRPHLKLVVSADEVARGKPHPDVYLEAAKRLGVNPANCLCLEDSGNGILSGKAAGMTVIAVPDERFPPAQEKLDQADYVLKSLGEFPALFEKLRATS
ncbi:MAG: HAD family phosphatase [Chloroflexota bacterium]